MTLNSSADRSGKRRERFAGPLAIVGLAGAGLLLLVALFPEKSLIRLLDNPEVTSPAQQRYLEALVRLRVGDSDLQLILIRSYLAAGCTEKAARQLELVSREQTAKQVREFGLLRYELYRQRLEFSLTEDREYHQIRRTYQQQIMDLIKNGASAAEIGRFLSDARRLGEYELATQLEQQLESVSLKGGAAAVEAAAQAALGRGDYRKAAAIYFAAMPAAAEQRQRYYLSGLRVLQSGNLLSEALAAAERYGQGWEQDRATQIWLARLALSANQPARAQHYMRQALGVTPGSRTGAGRP